VVVVTRRADRPAAGPARSALETRIRAALDPVPVFAGT
jgi:hypothetical protein